jgi:hypothetical protein
MTTAPVRSPSADRKRELVLSTDITTPFAPGPGEKRHCHRENVANLTNGLTTGNSPRNVSPRRPD